MKLCLELSRDFERLYKKGSIDNTLDLIIKDLLKHIDDGDSKCSKGHITVLSRLKQALVNGTEIGGIIKIKDKDYILT